MSLLRALNVLVVAMVPAIAQAQVVAQGTRDSIQKRVTLPAMVVTATRTPKTAFEAPAPVNYVDSAVLQDRLPNSAADLFRELPGLDVSGVGTNQVRPTVRGQRGQRILLLEDGVRMNNSRRQQDFGELPSLVGLTEIERVEVVRGPSSVLYGTDAIGGVVNLITREAPAATDQSLHGALSYLYGSADGQQRPSGVLTQRVGSFFYRVSALHRQSDAYSAPAGSYGDVRFSARERVHDTGVDDASYGLVGGWSPTATQQLAAKYERYQARDAGFGYVDPSLLGADQPLIRILYPDQDVARWSLHYRSTAVGSALADRVDVIGYGVDNARDLAMNIFIPFGPGTPAGAGVQVNSANFTKLRTLGVRAEATKALAGHLVTYGADAFRDRSDNTDSSATSVIGFGPTQTSITTRPQVPNATFRSAGVFAQGDFRIAEPLSLVVGARMQDVLARTDPDAASTVAATESHDRTAVGTTALLYRIGASVNLVASLGRGFRSPNLVERFFDGPTPEGSGYQRSNPTLRAETSRNVDLGVRFRRGTMAFEAFVFRNDLHDGISIAPTGDSVNRVPAFRNVNVDRLRFEGGEMQGSALLFSRFETRANWSRLSSHDVLDPNNPVGASYNSKLVGDLTYRPLAGRWWSSWVVRHNGRQTQEQIGVSPVGPVLPAFTVHTLRAGATLLERGGVRNTLTVGVENVGNVLYAESANVSFFRPQPGRSVVMSWSLEF